MPICNFLVLLSAHHTFDNGARKYTGIRGQVSLSWSPVDNYAVQVRWPWRSRSLPEVLPLRPSSLDCVGGAVLLYTLSRDR